MDNIIRIINFNFCNDKIKEPLRVDFYIPKNNVLTFDEKREHYQKGNELDFINYSGSIGLPSNIAINIPHERNNLSISGIIASPANILCLGSLELIIKPDSNLELLIQSDGLLVVDGEHITENDNKDSECDYCYGQRVFSDVQTEYMRKMISRMSPPKIIDTPATYNTDFRDSKIYAVRDIDICIKENIVNIMKSDGVTNVFYNNVEYKTVEANKKRLNNIDALKESLETALEKEEFEKAATIRDEIKKRESRAYATKIGKNITGK